MKEFETPTIETATFECADVITTSGKDKDGWDDELLFP